MNDPQNILLIQLRQLGDILLTTPCIRALREKFPKAKLSFLCHPMGKKILENNPHLDEVLYYPDGAELSAQVSFLKLTRKKKFDLCIDFMNNPRSAFFALITGSKTRIAFSSARSFAYTLKILKPDHPEYIVKTKFRLLTPLGIKNPSLQLELPWKPESIAPWQTWLKKNASILRKKIITVISPTHRRTARKWPIERYIATGKYIVTHWDAAVIWLWGSPEEEKEISEILQASGSAPNFYKAPATSIAELSAMLANCHLFIGNSNGPSHIATASGMCTIQLHGPTNPISWSAYDLKHRTLQSASFSMEDISEAEMEKVLQEFYPTIDRFAACYEQLNETNWHIAANRMLQ